MNTSKRSYLKTSYRLRRKDSSLVRATFHLDADVEEHFTFYQAVWNAMVLVDRQGRLQNSTARWNAIRKVDGVAIRGTTRQVFAEQVVKEYRHRRKKAAHPLRLKPLSRVKSIPRVGFGLEKLVVDAARKADILALNIVHARVHRSGRSFVVKATVKVPRAVCDLAAIKKRVYHHSKIEIIRLAVTKAGLYMVRENRKGQTVEVGTFPMESFTHREFAQVLYQEKIAPKAHIVGLDVSLLPTLSGGARHATSLLHRWLRSRKAVGAIEYRKVSTVGQETRSFNRDLELTTLSASIKRASRNTHDCRCPHCDTWITMKLDPVTMAPTHAVYRCSGCRSKVSVEQLLVSRCRAILADAAWHKFKPRPKGLDLACGASS